MYGDWEGIVHPSGVMYYFSDKTKTYTGTDIKRYPHDRLRSLDNWIDAACRRLQEDTWLLVVEPVSKQDGDYYEYYCADTKQHVIAWFNAFDASLLFQECTFAREWNHKRLELEAQFWKHVDFFPHHYEMRPSDAKELQAHLEWFLAEGLTLEQSTAASLFRNNEQTEKIISHIVRFEGIKQKRTLPLLLATAAMFGMPALVLDHIENIHVDGIINLLDIRQFIDHFNNDNVKYSTLVCAFSHIEIGKMSKFMSSIIEVGVIMAVDASILAIPDIGSQAIARTLCSLSLIFSVHCIFAGIVARHFSEKMKSLDFASQHLNDNRTRVAVIYSAPALL
ncbi:uncharacterized protein F5147DRAFT_776178 [Suillus discolor]|uniref:Uncharacterized protein n=1 Tax=Suillus discolor TaxID=1912936 RepID=A0A9P7JRN7_9AGAM|nr:uncharacterized protein F5147DRAFT_776178 [Suillus discolor]KAG2102823.1 hypothetical protein F5147DRAFT_776178 [Suillus discolor]